MPPRCPNGTRRNKKNGLCESKTKRKTLKRMTGQQVRAVLIKRTQKRFSDYWKREHPGERMPQIDPKVLKNATRRCPNKFRRNYRTANCDYMGY